MPDFFSRMIDRASGRVPLVRSVARPQLALQAFASGEVMRPPGGSAADPPSPAIAVPTGSSAEPRATVRMADAEGASVNPAQPGPHTGDATPAAARTRVPARSQEAAPIARSGPEPATPPPLDASTVRDSGAPSHAAVSAPETTRGAAGAHVTRASAIEPPTAPDAVLVRSSTPAPTAPPASQLSARGLDSARRATDLERAPDAILVQPPDPAPTVLFASPLGTPGVGRARSPTDLLQAPDAAATLRPAGLDAARPDVTRGMEHAAPSDPPASLLLAADRPEVATRAAAPAAAHVMRTAPRFELREAIAAVGRALAQPPRQQTPPPASDEVHITIGHIDVRAAAPPPPAAPARREPSISLAQYLRRPIGSPR